MGFDFTIAVVPENPQLIKELKYIKSALLYSDRVRLISPVAYLFTQLTDKKNLLNEKKAIGLLESVMPLAKLGHRSFYTQNIAVVQQMSQMINSKQYGSIPFSKKLSLKSQMKDFVLQMSEAMIDMTGLESSNQIQALIKNDQIIVEKFNTSLGDWNEYIGEYFKKLSVAVKTSYPLFDELSQNIMSAALQTHICNISDIERQRITHAGLADNYILRLPSFEDATIDEILDIKKELSQSVVRFRSSMLTYAQNIQSLPWDDDFIPECAVLYEREIAPAVLEIEETTKENSFVKNLGSKFLTEQGAWKSTGGLVLSIAATGVIPSFTDFGAANAPAFITGGAITATKIAQAYSEYSKKKGNVEKNDLYFYYQAGKLLEK